MKKNFFRLSRVFSFIAVGLFLSACDPKVPGPTNTEIDANKLADVFEAKLKNNCVGYQFVIHYKGENKAFRAGGDARLSQDAPARAMTNFDKYNVASVSKTITAAALMYALNAQGKSVDDAIGTYLPNHWNLPVATSSLTFRNLFQHKSGFHTSYGSDYANLKKLMEEGPTTDKTWDYNNANYAIMRLLIVKIAGYSIDEVAPGSSAAVITTKEATQAQSFADNYIDYCQKKVFDPINAGLTNMACKPTDADPGLCYQFPKDGGNGGDFGDMTLTSAERGWNITSLQLANFMSALHFSEKILPKTLSDKMKDEQLGYDAKTTTPKGMVYYYKGGYYPGKQVDGITNQNPGELNSCIIGFDNGIQISFIVNSQYKPGANFDSPYNAAIASFDEWYK